MRLEAVQRVLQSLNAPYALIGGHAMAARGYPRFTVDVDILTTDARVLDAHAWEGLVAAGAAVSPCRGDADDPLGGVVHVLLADGTDVDVVLGKWHWESGVIERAEPMHVADVQIRVPQTSDLILLKLAAGGYGDLQDAAALLALGGQSAIAGVERHIGEVRPDVRSLWQDLLARYRSG